MDIETTTQTPAPFTADLRADQAGKRVLLHLLKVMEHNEPGVLQRIDEECLHDYRIAIRRARSVLGQLKDIFPVAPTRRFRARLAELGKLSAPARDFDVHLLDFDQMKSLLPKPYQEDLEPLRQVLQQQGDLAYGKLFSHLGSTAHRQFLGAWRQFLEAASPGQPRAQQAKTPIGDVAQQRIWKLYRRAVKQGKTVKAGSPPDSIHELRKTCKKLRYLLESFRHMYPTNSMSHSIKVLKRLQDYLGEFQDAHVQAETVKSLSAIVRKQPNLPTETLLAMGMLLAALDRRQHHLREQFPKRFKAFNSEPHQAEYRNLFHPDRNESPAPTDDPRHREQPPTNHP